MFQQCTRFSLPFIQNLIEPTCFISYFLSKFAKLKVSTATFWGKWNINIVKVELKYFDIDDR